MSTDKLYLRALAAARAEAVATGITPTGSRLGRIYAETAAPSGGWKSRVLASRKAYLDQIEKRLKDRKVKYVRVRDLIYTMLPQADLDHVAELTHLEIRKVSKGHVGWRVIHPEGLHEYFFVGDDLHRASHVRDLDPDSHQRTSSMLLATGLAPSIALLRSHGVEIPADLAKKERKALEAHLWKGTHKDYRTTTGSKRSILHLGPAGTTLTPLSALSLEDLRKKSGL